MDLNTWTNGESQDPGRMIHPLFHKNTISKKIKAEILQKIYKYLKSIASHDADKGVYSALTQTWLSF